MGQLDLVTRPGKSQLILHNGHKRVHALKFLAIVAPNWLIANLYGPVKGKRHDSILNQMQQYSVNSEGEVLCVYGDPAYPLRLNFKLHIKGLG